MVRTVNIKDSHVAELVEIFGKDYQAQIQDPAEDEGVLMTNPQTKANFAGEKFDADIKEYIKRRVMTFRQRVALEAADTTDITE